jgi:hypothetical protein
MVFPRNNWLIRCLVVTRDKRNSKKNFAAKKVVLSAGAPTTNNTRSTSDNVSVIGQRVLFRQLDRARKRCESGGGGGSLSTTEQQEQEQRVREQKQQERLFLLNLSRICKEKKAQDSNFDQKRFVKEGLILKFGESKAKTIMFQVHDRIRVLREAK